MIIHSRIIAAGAIALPVLIAAGLFLATHTIAPPQHKIEKSITSDHFFK